MNDDREHLILECKRIEEDSKYTAEAHFQVASSEACKVFWVKAIPAVLSAISGIGLLAGAPGWFAWLAIISSAVFAINSVLNPDKEFQDHTNAGKYYTTLKHESRSLCETFHHELDKRTFAVIVSILRVKYDNISEMTPKTTEKSFGKTRSKIKLGIHEPDHKNNF